MNKKNIQIIVEALPAIAALTFIFFSLYPIMVITIYGCLMVSFIAYSIVNAITTSQQERENVQEKRKEALKVAKPFLKEYDDPFGVLCARNENCSARCLKGEKIIAQGKQPAKRRIICFTATSRLGKTPVNKAFNDICLDFNENTTINKIYTILKTSGLLIDTQTLGSYTPKPSEIALTQTVKKISKKTQIKKTTKNNNEKIKKIEINTASEAEIQALPGINIVIAKKIITKRKEKGGFNDIDDFIKTMGIKSHFAEKIRQLVTVEKMKKQNNEDNKGKRILDI